MSLVSSERPIVPIGHTGGETRGFIISIVRALAAGDLMGAGLAGFVSLIMQLSEAGSLIHSLPIAIRMALLVGGTGVIASVFPLGPLAALLARHPYRRGVRSQPYYGLMGAATSLALPVAILAFYFLNTTDSPVFEADDAMWWLAGALWFAISGATGGIVFARSIRSYDPKDLRDVALVF